MKVRSEKRERTVPHDVGGKTHHVRESYSVEVPVAPADWDALVLRAVMASTCMVVVGAVVWSTVSIGALLSMAAPVWVSYLVAGVFDLAWITCLATEWLARYDSRKASLPRKAGWAALVVSMAAIFTHGYLAGSVWVGIFGAVVSALAKGMWLVVMKHTAKELDAKTRQWVEAETAEVNAQLAMAAVTRQLNRNRAKVSDELSAVSVRPDTVVLDRPDVSGHPDTERPQVSGHADKETDTPSLTSSDTVSAASGPAELIRALSGQGVRAQDIVSEASRTRPDIKSESVRRTLKRMQDRAGNGQYL